MRFGKLSYGMELLPYRYRLPGNFRRAKIFLSRPRRFGKSLLVSTFESLFRFGLRDFKGLAIEALWNDKTYEVVRLDFSGLKALGSIDAYEEALQSLIRTKFAKAGFSYSAQKGSTSFFDQFGDWLNLNISPKNRPWA